MSSECGAQHRRLRASAGLKPPRVQQGGNSAADCQARGRSRRRSHTHCQQRRHRTHGATRCHRTVARPGEQVCLNHIQSSLGWPPQVGWHKLRSRSTLRTLGRVRYHLRCAGARKRAARQAPRKAEVHRGSAAHRAAQGTRQREALNSLGGAVVGRTRPAAGPRKSEVHTPATSSLGEARRLVTPREARARPNSGLASFGGGIPFVPIERSGASQRARTTRDATDAGSRWSTAWEVPE